MALSKDTIIGATAGGDDLLSQSDKAIELAQRTSMLFDAIADETTVDNNQIK